MNKFEPDVTILIPVKNVAKYIDECLDALMNQDYPKNRFEVWVLDNNSTDGTQEIINQYPKDRVKIFQVGVDSPPIKYNKILPMVKSDLVGFVDGDANVDKYWLKKVVEALNDPRVAGASGVIFTANTDKLIPRLIGYELQDRYERLPKEIKRVATMHVVYKRKVLEEIGGFSEKLKTGYDCELGYRINDARYKIIFAPDAKVWHNHRENIWAYFKQQYEYGKFALPRYIKVPKNIKGDKVTPFRMISQPLFYLVTILLLTVNIFLRLPPWIPLIPLLILLIGYLFSAVRISIKYKKIEALLLIVIYIIRPIGWSLGAFRQLLSMIGITKH